MLSLIELSKLPKLQKIYFFFLISILLICACSREEDFDGLIDNDSTMEETEAPIPLRNKAIILNYFETLIANEELIVGQQCGNTPSSIQWHYNRFVETLERNTGKYVGLIGADFGWSSGQNYPVQTLINHWKEGGLVAVSWHADNPFVDGEDVYWNTVEDKEKIQLPALLKEAHQTK